MSVSYASMQAVLNREFQEPLSDLVARSNPLLEAIQKRAVASDAVYIKARASSTHGAGPILDNTVVTFDGTERSTYAGGRLDWATYISKFRVGKRLMSQVSGNPGAIGMILRDEIEAAGKDLADAIARDIFAGSVANGLVGLQQIIGSTGTYAGIDRATVPNWASVVLDAANTEISTGMLYELDELFFNRNKYGFAESPERFTGITSSKVMTKYKALMENIDLSSLATAHFVNQANQSGQLGIGKTGFMGVPFIRDANISNAAGDTANTGRLYFLDMSQIYLAVLDPTAGDSNIHQVQGFQTGMETTGIRAAIEILGNEGEFVAGYVKAYVQVATPNPAAAGALIRNISLA